MTTPEITDELPSRTDGPPPGGVPAFSDTHCHFDFPPFLGDEAASLAAAAAVGVGKILVPAVESRYFARVLELARRFSPLYAALGLHPLYVARHDDADLELLETCLRQRPEKLVAVGEIGLDLYMAEPRVERQRELLQAQLALAKRHDLPVILHSRRSHDQLAALLRRAALPRTGVVHGFAGSYEQAAAFIRLGYCIGVGGTITYPRASKTQRAIARLPVRHLLLETDAPDMPMCGHQGAPNRPERIAEVFRALRQLRPEPAEELASALQSNAAALFGWGEAFSSPSLDTTNRLSQS